MGPYPGVSRETTQLAGRQIDRHPDLPRLERRGFANISLRTQVSAVLDRFVLWRSVQLRPLLSCCTRARRTCGQELNNVQLTCRALQRSRPCRSTAPGIQGWFRMREQPVRDSFPAQQWPLFHVEQEEHQTRPRIAGVRLIPVSLVG
jgi:hypothetical protein